MADPLEEARELLSQGRAEEAEARLLALVSAAPPREQGRLASRAGRVAYKAGQAVLAARLYARAQILEPRDADHPHDRGLALLEAGEVGLAAQAQGQALAIDPEHVGARAQRAAALEVLGDDEGAAHELEQLLLRLGPQLALHARLQGLREAARRATQKRLLLAPLPRLQGSHLVGAVFAREPEGRAGASFRAPFGALRAALDAGGRVRELSLLFEDMEASLQRTDLAYGGTTEDDHGRRVPLDEFTSAATVFLAEALGIEPSRSRRILHWLLTAEAGRGPHRLAGAQASWLIVEDEGRRRYGLSVEPAPELV